MLSKRLVRAAFIQGPGSNYRRLTASEKAEAEKSFYLALQNQKSFMPKIRNLSNLFKELISNAQIPVAKQIPTSFTLHNDQYTDNYSWVSEELNSQDLISYLTHELNYTETILGKSWLLSKEIHKELLFRRPEYLSQAIEKSGFIYKQEEDAIIRTSGDLKEQVVSKTEILEHPVLQHNEELLKFIRENPFVINNLQFSHDHKLVAICFPTQLSQGIIVKHMDSGMTGFFVESIDEFFVFDRMHGLYYTEKDSETGKAYKCWREDFGKNLTEEEKILQESRMHIAKKPVNTSVLVYEETDKQFNVEVSLSLSGEYVLIKSDNMSCDPKRVATEFRYRAANKSTGEFLIVQERKEGVNYDVKHLGDEFFFLASSPEEYNGKVLKVSIPPFSSFSPPETPPKISDSTDLQTGFMGATVHTPHNPLTYIEHIEAFENHLVSILIDSSTSLQHIQIDDFKNNSTDIVAYDKYEGSLKVANNKSYRIKLAADCQDYHDKHFKYLLSTLHAPEQLISYNLETRLNSVVDYMYTVPGVKIQDYVSERIVLPANDGEHIPVTLVYNKRNVKTGNNAVGVIKTWGGDIERSHNFCLDYSWYSLLDRGYMLIVPHIRGSYDVNRVWYEKGIGFGKIRHLQDLLDVVVSLVSEKIVNSVGGYADTPSGGLTLASLVLKEPDLFSAVVIRNPLLDLLGYLKNKRSISEFGDINDIEAYKVIRSYNPYYQRFPEEFCPIMITADYDNELAFQAIKFLAKSREIKKAATVIYKEFPTWTHEEIKKTEEFSFLIENTKPHK